MKSNLPMPAERTKASFVPLPPVGPRGLCLEIDVHGVVSQRHRGPEAAVLSRLKKRARLYHDLATIKGR